MVQDVTAQDTTVWFGEKLAASGSFKTLFRDGMALVEETAGYLDGDGREDARRLPRMAALAYASESMRLTTRLMQIASWLLLQRAVNEGEMTKAEAMADKRRTRLAWQQPPVSENPTQILPALLLDLVEKSLHLQDRILRLDQMMVEPAKAPIAIGRSSALEAQMSRLQDAFGTPSPAR